MNHQLPYRLDNETIECFSNPDNDVNSYNGYISLQKFNQRITNLSTKALFSHIDYLTSIQGDPLPYLICAFANDLNNWGGGFIYVGIEENNSQPVLPPAGIVPEHLDAIQGEAMQLSHQVQPNYFPIMQPYVPNEKIHSGSVVKTA